MNNFLTPSTTCTKQTGTFSNTKSSKIAECCADFVASLWRQTTMDTNSDLELIKSAVFGRHANTTLGQTTPTKLQHL